MAHAVGTFDVRYTRPEFAAVHWIADHGELALVDCGTASSAERLVQAIADQGYAPDAVAYVFVTHVHLDHAGGAGALAAALPRAQFLAHPRAVTHLAQPERLIQASIQVYGAERFAALYGTVTAVPEARIVPTRDGQTFALGRSTFSALHTPGHALHHHVLFDTMSRAVFTGDAFGLAYPAVTSASGPLLWPTTTPTQFDPDAMLATIQRIAALQPECVYLTHYGAMGTRDSIPKLAQELSARVQTCVAVARAHANAPDRFSAILEGLRQAWAAELAAQGVADVSHALTWLENDLDLNAQGLVTWLEREARARA
jgi:glyoxylase-like metal-dependent hydrolase (beta-lactamase superfamily II)